MPSTNEDYLQLGCGQSDQAAADHQAPSVQSETSSHTDTSAVTSASSDSSGASSSESPAAPPDEPATEKRARRSFQTPTRPGRGRLASGEHAMVRNMGSYGDDTGRILLPIDLRDELEEQAILEYEARLAERAAISHAKMAAEEERKAKAAKEAKEAKEAKGGKGGKPSAGDEKEAGELSGKQVGKRALRSRRFGEISSLVNPTGFCEQVAALPAKHRLAVYSEESLKKLEKGSGSVDTEVHKRNAQLFEKLEPKGVNRRVGMARSIDALLALEKSHPHFSEVIQFVANRIALQKASRRPVRLPPMMLFGPPGVGKTHFCEALAAVLHVPVRRHPMDQAETSSALLGSDLSWGNTRYGLVFELLAFGDHANPVVILDELDKAGRMSTSSGSLTSPTSVLHSLLEPVSALRVRDISVDVEMDASLITWIATANYPWLVAPTLRSRLKEFLIRMPTAEQSLLVATSVVAQAIKDSGVPWSEPPDRSFISAVAHLSAREIYQATATAAAAAVRRVGKGKQGVGRVQVSDLPLEVLLADEITAVPRVVLH